MTLLEAIRTLDSLDQGSTIYASEPWTENSEVLIAPEPESEGLPSEAANRGMTYFLEVFIAGEFLEGWVGNLDEEPTLREKCARLIEYAISDA